jgi:hypothetical protein
MKFTLAATTAFALLLSVGSQSVEVVCAKCVPFHFVRSRCAHLLNILAADFKLALLRTYHRD